MLLLPFRTQTFALNHNSWCLHWHKLQSHMGHSYLFLKWSVVGLPHCSFQVQNIVTDISEPYKVITNYSRAVHFPTTTHIYILTPLAPPLSFALIPQQKSSYGNSGGKSFTYPDASCMQGPYTRLLCVPALALTCSMTEADSLASS